VARALGGAGAGSGEKDRASELRKRGRTGSMVHSTRKRLTVYTPLADCPARPQAQRASKSSPRAPALHRTPRSAACRCAGPARLHARALGALPPAMRTRWSETPSPSRLRLRSRKRGAGAVSRPRGGGFPPPPPPRTKWTRRVPHPVLIGHAASLTVAALGLPLWSYWPSHTETLH